MDLQATHKTIYSCALDDKFGYFGWPTVIRTSDGTLLAAGSGFRNTHVCPFGKAVIFKSVNEGASWSEPAILINSRIDVRDVGLTALNHGDCLVSFFTSDTRHFYPSGEPAAPNKIDFRPVLNCWSDDDVRRELGSFTGIYTADGKLLPVSPCPVSSPHGPIRRRDGSLLFLGNRFGVMDAEGKIDFSMQLFCASRIQAWSSDDDGKSWNLCCADVTCGGREKIRFCEPHLIELADGRILGMLRAEEQGAHFSLWQTISADGGCSWSEPQFVTHGSPPHLFRHSSGLLICSYGFRQKPFGQRVIFSADEGRSWSGEWIIRGDGEDVDLGYPSTTELADGALLTVYYQKVGSSANRGLHSSRWQIPESLIYQPKEVL